MCTQYLFVLSLSPLCLHCDQIPTHKLVKWSWQVLNWHPTNAMDGGHSFLNSFRWGDILLVPVLLMRLQGSKRGVRIGECINISDLNTLRARTPPDGGNSPIVAWTHYMLHAFTPVSTCFFLSWSRLHVGKCRCVDKCENPWVHVFLSLLVFVVLFFKRISCVLPLCRENLGI